MDNELTNLSANRLPAGITLEGLAGAVRVSGYPLQAVVARELSRDFQVVEEWGYVDRTTKEHRSLDIFAYRAFERKSPKLAPGLSVLAECKRADLPYILFPPGVNRVMADFPAMFGFARSHFELHRPGVGSQECSPARFFRVGDFPFVASGPTVATAFTRVERKGKSFDISGTEPFNKVVLPLISALDHCRDIAGKGTHPVIAICLCIVDAPLVVARGTPEHPDLSLEPWIRVVRQEAVQQQQWWARRHYVVDCVHRAFLAEYVSGHLLPFAKALSERMLEKEDIVVAAKGAVPDWETWEWRDLTPLK